MHRLPYSEWVTMRRHRPHYRYSHVCKQSVASCPTSLRHAEQEATNVITTQPATGTTPAIIPITHKGCLAKTVGSSSVVKG